MAINARLWSPWVRCSELQRAEILFRRWFARMKETAQPCCMTHEWSSRKILVILNAEYLKGRWKCNCTMICSWHKNDIRRELPEGGKNQSLSIWQGDKCAVELYSNFTTYASLPLYFQLGDWSACHIVHDIILLPSIAVSARGLLRKHVIIGTNSRSTQHAEKLKDTSTAICTPSWRTRLPAIQWSTPPNRSWNHCAIARSQQRELGLEICILGIDNLRQPFFLGFAYVASIPRSSELRRYCSLNLVDHCYLIPDKFKSWIGVVWYFQ